MGKTVVLKPKEFWIFLGRAWLRVSGPAQVEPTGIVVRGVLQHDSMSAYEFEATLPNRPHIKRYLSTAGITIHA